MPRLNLMAETRRKSYNDPGHSHLLTFCCYRRQTYFASDDCKDVFIDCLRGSRDRLGFKIQAYVVMPEHVHLLVWPQNSATVAQILQSIKQPVSARLRHKMPGPAPAFWQSGGGHDRNIFSKEAFAAAIDYIHANPVRFGLVSSPLEYTWSSANWYEDGTGILPVDVFCPWD